MSADFVEKLRLAEQAWLAHVNATERTNAAIPAIDATRAEREVYDERYTASEECKRAMWAAALDLTKFVAETEAAAAIEALDARIRELEEVADRALLALVPLGTLASGGEGDPGANMLDPLSKWLTIGQLHEARQTIDALSAALTPEGSR